MLTRLSVSNFAIIDRLDLSFGQGLTIITGETGAGKSILLGALRLILGDRADSQLLMDASRKCVIEAVFDVSNLQLESFFMDNELDFEPETIIRRELLPSGKSRAFINDTPVNLTVLQTLGEFLIDIHSQFNTENLLNPAFQLQILDAFAQQVAAVKSYQELFFQRSQLQNQLKSLTKEREDKERETDYKQFLLEELQDANLKAGEIQTLEVELNELQNLESIQEVLADNLSKLDANELGILDQLRNNSVQLMKIADFGEEFQSFYSRMESVRIELEDLHHEMKSKLQQLEADPQRLSEINERMDVLSNLLNKHKVQSVEELMALESSLRSDNESLEALTMDIELLQNQMVELEKTLDQKAQLISKNRSQVIPIVSEAILDSLSKLGMENSSLAFELVPHSEYTSTGKDVINFLFSANKGAKMQTLGKAISGGERSRLMLAVKKVLAGKLALPTLILDEIDTGVSGKVAHEVGKMMKEMAKSLQLISITHLPQVASKANRHLKVQKKPGENRTLTEVVLLSDKERIEEIAVLLSGSVVTETALIQAKELIES